MRARLQRLHFSGSEGGGGGGWSADADGAGHAAVGESWWTVLWWFSVWLEAHLFSDWYLCWCRTCPTAGAFQGTPARRRPPGPGKPGLPPESGASSGEGVAWTGTGPASSADTDSGPLAATSLGLTGAWVEGISETG